MRNWITCLLLMIFTIFARTAWSATGLIVQNFLVAGGRPVISGNSIAVNNFIALLGGGPTSIYELDSGGNWNLTQTLPTGGPAAISGNTLLLGNVPAQPLTFNPAAVYVSDAAGNWTQQALLSAPDTNDYDEYGTAVAVDGNIAVVGAEVHGRGESATGNSYGAAYIFQRDSTGSWSLVQELLPPALDPAGNPVIQFGASVAVSGKTLLVYANEQVTVGNVTNSNPQIYVYGEQNNGNWVLQTVLSGPYSTVATNPITIQGNQIAVQTPVATDDSDKVDVYVPDASGTWNLSQALSGASVQITGPPGQTFGSWTSLTDPLLLIVAGSNAYSNCGLPCGGEPQGVTTGGLYAYMLNGGSWQPLDVYAPQSMGALTMIDAVATDGVTVVADGSMQSPSGSIQNGIVVMQVGSIPSSGYSIVPSYKATPSSPPPTGQPSSSSGGGGFLWEILLLSVLWGVRQLQQNRKA